MCLSREYICAFGTFIYSTAALLAISQGSRLYSYLFCHIVGSCNHCLCANGYVYGWACGIKAYYMYIVLTRNYFQPELSLAVLSLQCPVLVCNPSSLGVGTLPVHAHSEPS